MEQALFNLPPGRQFGNQPKIGVLAPNLVARAAAAFNERVQ